MKRLKSFSIDDFIDDMNVMIDVFFETESADFRNKMYDDIMKLCITKRINKNTLAELFINYKLKDFVIKAVLRILMRHYIEIDNEEIEDKKLGEF